MLQRTQACLVMVGIIGLQAYANEPPKQCYPDAMSAYQVLAKADKQAKAGVIDINTASVADFVGLSGIGHASAEAIVAYRQKHGRFASVDELEQVKGVGKATIAKNRHRLTVLGTN